MAKDKCTCKKPPECEECPEWIFTFADLVMLMMGFFVILWVLKPAPGKSNSDASANEDWIAVAAAVREAFGYMPDPHSTDPVDLHMLLKRLHTINPVKGPKQASRVHDEQHGSEGTDREVQSIRQGKHSLVGGRVTFDAGKSSLTPEARKTLDQVAEQIRGHYNIVDVKGHTALDDLPEGATPQQQMDLSLRRAQAASDYLVAHGIAPEIVRIEGCSVFEPVKQHVYDPQAAAENRRVEVEVTSQLVSDRQGTAPSGAPATQP